LIVKNLYKGIEEQDYK